MFKTIDDIQEQNWSLVNDLRRWQSAPPAERKTWELRSIALGFRELSYSIERLAEHAS